jgi:hypothetical protein
MPNSVDQIITVLQQRRDNILQALLNDSLNPLPSDSFEGQSVDRDGWRANLQKQLDDIDAMISRYQPFEVSQIQS